MRELRGLIVCTNRSVHVCYFVSSGCPSGYRGIGCVYKCEPPFFGPNCANKCYCREDQCDYQYGCKLSSSSGINTLTYVNDSRTTVK